MTASTSDRAWLPDDGVLEGFLTQAVVDDYAGPTHAGERRHELIRRGTSALVMVAIGLIVTTALMSTRTSDASRQQTRDALAERVVLLTSAIAERQAAVDAQAATVERLQDEILAGEAAGSVALRSSLASQGATTELSGPGTVVSIDDAPGAQTGSLNQVLDRDLQDIVNALWSMGATGVAVNGHRLTGSTAIRGAGEAILVDYQPLTPPYSIAAVGVAGDDLADSALQELLTLLQADYGLASQVRSGEVTLPAGELRTARFARTDQG